MYNKKRSPFDPSLEDVSSADPWIWGNQRGGGGAPLRDMDGNHLANLKKVLHGEVDVDHSPVSATKGASTVRRLSPRGRGDGYDVSYQNNSHDAVAAKKKISFQETDHRVKDRSSRRNKNDYSDDHGDDSYDEQQPFRQSIMRQDRNRDDREAPQQQQHRTQASIPGLEHVSSPPKKFMSAVSDMHSGGGSSDRDMKMRKQQQYQQLLQQQIDEKQRRKEKERRDEEDRKRRELSEYYQSTQQLQQGPMRSRSDRSYEERDSRSGAVVGIGSDDRGEEDRGSSYGGGRGSQGDRGVVSRNRPGRQVADSSDDEERSTRRGGSPVGKKPLRPIPPMMKLRQTSAADDDGSDADYLENDNSARLYNQRMKAKGGGAHAMQQEEARMAKERRHSWESSREQDYIRRQHDDSEDEPPTHGPSGRPPRGKDVRRNVGDRDKDNNDHRPLEGGQRIRRNGAAEKFVSMDEYDELSKLCDSLLAQQNQLKEELRSQAAALKALKRGEVSAVAGVAGRQQLNGAIKSSRGNAAALPPQSALSRSKSAVPTTGARDGRTKARDPPPGPASARPSSMHTAAASKDDGKAKAGHHQMRRSVSPNKKGGKIPNLAFGSNASSSSANSKDSRLPLKAQQAASNVLGSKSSSSSNSGFSKLQQSAAVRGPLVVVHEEEQSSSSSVGRAKGAGLHHSTSSSRPPGQFDGLELRGQSSYVRVTGDMISGDQLDQLLLQARNARA